MRAYGYTRVSTSGQEISPEVQREGIEAKAKGLGADLVTIYDEVISGGTTLRERPILGQLVGELQEGDLLLIYKRDRIARDVLNGLLFERELSRIGVKMVSCAGEGTEGETPQDKFVGIVIAAANQMERDMIRLRTREVMRYRKKNGLSYGNPQYGQRNEGGKIVEDQAERELISTARQMRENGKSYRQIAEAMNSQAMTLRGKKLDYLKVYKLVNNGKEKEHSSESN